MVAVPARAALVGNPSDLHGGAVLAVPVRAFHARAEIRPAPQAQIVGDVGGRFLVAAALARSDAPRGAPFELLWRTDIPRSVGLAGSSAIVIAALRAVGEHRGHGRDALQLAELALSVERDDLGIIAGLQDRAVQAFDSPVLVDVTGARPIVTALHPERPLRFVVAWWDAARGDSGGYHARLRQPNRDVDAGMRELTALGRAAAVAFSAGDAGTLADLMAASSATRSRVAPLPSLHETLAEAVTKAGLSPSSTGSGGAVGAVLNDDDQLERLRRGLEPLGAKFVVESFGVLP